ncbi:MAG: hypothetical protein HY873_13200 [Chloroflexi bacterium]|nr:hypothetical protein [Chloroflexota bacterium]
MREWTTEEARQTFREWHRLARRRSAMLDAMIFRVMNEYAVQRGAPKEERADDATALVIARLRQELIGHAFTVWQQASGFPKDPPQA